MRTFEERRPLIEMTFDKDDIRLKKAFDVRQPELVIKQSAENHLVTAVQYVLFNFSKYISL